MNIAQIESNLQNFITTYKQGAFIYNFLLAFGTPKATVKRLQKGGLNLSKIEGELAWKKKLFFKSVGGEDRHQLIEIIKKNDRALKHAPRFIIITDNENILAFDTKTNEGLDIPITDLPKHFDFFLPLAGMEKTQHQNENPADIKAAGKMAKLFDEIKKDNPTHSAAEVHNLNVFLSRLLFCFFAEDTGIFEETQFTNAIASHTQEDGSDLNAYLDTLFEVLNTDNKHRNKLPSYLTTFPYVNGGLFRHRQHAPVFNRKSRATIIECGSLQWKDIHPDIFGSMFQAVIKPEERGEKGMHYTSVPNIMKVIKPLFLDELYEELETVTHEPKRLLNLLDRIGKMKIFDPACGSGNFLIIAYKELRALEIKILQQLNELKRAASGFLPSQLELIPKAQLNLAAQFEVGLFSRIELSNFYGIELDDFAHEIAILSLWLAQHQMNMKFKEVLGTANATLPLRAGGNIVQGNATRTNWVKVCPHHENETYILGNPPYVGGKGQSKEQKEDMEIVFDGVKSFKELDYIACWFFLATRYIDHNSKFAFVTTSSLCQGAQVEQLWPLLFSYDIEISFAYKPFIWSNNAKANAGVACSVIGIVHKSNQAKFLYHDTIKHQVKNINAYLANGPDRVVAKSLNPISALPPIITGNSPYENGNLMLSRTEMEDIVNVYPSAKILFKRLNGADEFLNSIERYCLWIKDDLLKLALSVPPVADRIAKTKKFRLTGGEVARGIANRPHQFRYTYSANESQIVIPIHSSERREYIPMGFLPKDYIIISSAAAIYDCETYVFGVISSKMHMVWVKITAGRLENRLRYLSALCYNTFPFPEISAYQKQSINLAVFRLLEERERNSEKTIAQLYDPDKMPQGLREAHHELDIAIERCYRSKPFLSDEERLEYLFNLYEQMIESEKSKGTLFEVAPKPKKKKKAHA